MTDSERQEQPAEELATRRELEQLRMHVEDVARRADREMARTRQRVAELASSLEELWTIAQGWPGVFQPPVSGELNAPRAASRLADLPRRLALAQRWKVVKHWFARVWRAILNRDNVNPKGVN